MPVYRSCCARFQAVAQEVGHQGQLALRGDTFNAHRAGGQADRSVPGRAANYLTVLITLLDFCPMNPCARVHEKDHLGKTRAPLGEQACNSTADISVSVSPQGLDPGRGIDNAECHYCAALVPSSSVRSMKSMSVPRTDVNSHIRLRWLYSTIAMMTASLLVEADVRFIRSFRRSSGISIVVFVHIRLVQAESFANPFGRLN